MAIADPIDLSRDPLSFLAESFTEDIIIDILLRLPAKSLVRFKCVCKWWWSLISDPGFVKSRLQRLKAGDVIPSQRIIIGGHFGPFEVIEDEAPDGGGCSPLETVDYEALDGGNGKGRHVVLPHVIKPSWKPCVMGSCDGLVCLLVLGIFLIYNPTTREYRELRNFGIDVNDELFYGFGYDSRSDDYKVVEGTFIGNWDVAIFSLKSASWRRIQVKFENESHLLVSHKGVYWNGALHWCVVDAWSIKPRDVIMSFDLSEERFHREPPVPEVDEDIVLKGLGIHGTSLFIYSYGSDPHIEAWTTDEHGRGGGSWTKWFTVDCIPAFINRNPSLGKGPLVYTRNGKIVFLVEGRMILFNPEDNTCSHEYAIYLETLVAPYLGGSGASRVRVTMCLIETWILAHLSFVPTESDDEPSCTTVVSISGSSCLNIIITPFFSFPFQILLS